MPLIGSHSWLGRSVVIDTILNLSVPEVHLEKKENQGLPSAFHRCADLQKDAPGTFEK